MTASPPYLSANELELRLGRETMIALFDDTGERVVNSDAVDAVLVAASRRTTSALASEYLGTLPFPENAIPEMAIELTYEYAMALAWPRNPDYLKAAGLKLGDILARAEALAKDLRLAVKRMVDAQSPTPANVGGDTTSMEADHDFPTPPKPIFVGGMGDF